MLFHLNFFQFRLGRGSHQFIQGKHDHGGSATGRSLNSPCWSHQGTRETKNHSCLHRWPKPGLCITNSPVTTTVSSKLGYTPVAYSVRSNDAWNKSAIWIGHAVAVLGTSSEAVSSENSYQDSDFSVLTLKAPTFVIMSCNSALNYFFLGSTL